jgi:pyrrolysyl-tRNA synthetase-like protein
MHDDVQLREKRVTYRKQVPLFRLIEKVKLWPSRNGILHGIKSFEARGAYGLLKTHCNREMVIRDSKNSKAARWLRNKWFVRPCEECAIPAWKLQKYAATTFRRRYGSMLTDRSKNKDN